MLALTIYNVTFKKLKFSNIPINKHNKQGGGGGGAMHNIS